MIAEQRRTTEARIHTEKRRHGDAGRTASLFAVFVNFVAFVVKVVRVSRRALAI
jgi:hypothetical protein